MGGRVSPHDPVFRTLLYRQFRGLDFWTAEPLLFEAMHIDHVWPKAEGGQDNLYNFVPTSPYTNWRKRKHAHLHTAYPVLSILRTEFGPKLLSKLRHANRKLAIMAAKERGEGYWWWTTNDKLVGTFITEKKLYQDSLFWEMNCERFAIAAWLRRHGPRWNGLAIHYGISLGDVWTPGNVSREWGKICAVRTGATA